MTPALTVDSTPWSASSLHSFESVVLAAAWPPSSSCRAVLICSNFAWKRSRFLLVVPPTHSSFPPLPSSATAAQMRTVLGVERNHQPDGHQDDANPDPELPRLVRNLKPVNFAQVAFLMANSYGASCPLVLFICE